MTELAIIQGYLARAAQACDIVEAIHAALKLPGVTPGEVLDENSPIRDAIRAYMAGGNQNDAQV